MGKTLTNKSDRERATRSDKKRQIKPTVSREVYESVAQISYITGHPIKTIGEALVVAAIRDDTLLRQCRPRFRRDLAIGSRVLMGTPKVAPYRPSYAPTDRRLHMKFAEHQHDDIAAFAYALDCPVATAAGLLVTRAVKRKEIVLDVILRYAPTYVDQRKRRVLREMLEDIGVYIDGIETDDSAAFAVRRRLEAYVQTMREGVAR